MKKLMILSLFMLFLNVLATHANILENCFMGNGNRAAINLGNNYLVFENNKLIISKVSNYENNQSFAEIKEDKTILDFVDANPNAFIKYEKPIKLSLYLENIVEKIEGGKSVLVKNLYDNIDLRLRTTKNNKIKYDIILYPEANLPDVRIKIDNSDSPFISYQTEKLRSFILNGKNKTYVESKAILNNSEMTFELQGVNEGDTVLIDPEVSFSTYYNGRGNDEFLSQKFLEDGSYVLTGTTSSSDFPISDNKVHRSYANEVTVMKFSAENELVWCTILGGAGNEYGRDILVDKDDNLWVVGQSASSGFPITPDAEQRYYAGGIADGFITKLDSDGQILYSSFFGSSEYESLLGLAMDSEGNIWVSGQTAGSIMTTPNAYSRSSSGGYDGFFCKFSSTGKVLLSCYVAGSEDEACENICMSDDDNPVISGWSGSSNIGIKNGTYTSFMGNRDAIIMKVDKNTGEPIWGSYFGGSSDDRSYDISYWKDSYYITGRTTSNNLPTNYKSFQSQLGGMRDNFVAKFKEWGVLEWCSYYGGSSSENEGGEASYLYGTAVNENGELLFSGRTASNDLPVTDDAFQKDFGGYYDSFIAKVSKEGNLLYSSYVGGEKNEVAWNCDFDPKGEMFLIGYTTSNDFPVTENALYNKYYNDYDAYILRFGELPDPCHQSAFELWSNPPSDFILNSEAVLLNDTLIMHSAYGLKKGSAWYHKRVPVSVGFTTEFKFVINYENVHHLIGDVEYGEGGLAFVIQNNSTSVIGLEGHGLGYDGIPNGIAIEFDTYKDHSQTENDMRDPSNGHISVMGMDNSLLSSHHDVQKTFANVELKDDGTVYHCKVEYDGEKQQMKIYFGELGSELQEVISLTIDLVYSLNLKDDIYAFLGFTAANGRVTQTHNIFDWSVCPDRNSPGTSIGDYADNDANVFVFPNPAENDISIHYAPKKMSYVNINLYDVAGKKVGLLYSGLDHPGEQTISMPLPDKLSKGMYVIEIDYGYTKEFVQLVVK